MSRAQPGFPLAQQPSLLLRQLLDDVLQALQEVSGKGRPHLLPRPAPLAWPHSPLRDRACLPSDRLVRLPPCSGPQHVSPLVA